MLIRSTSNPQIKYIRQLFHKRKARKAYREFFVEGVQAISEAYQHGWHIKKLIYSPTLVRSDWGKKTVAESDALTHLQVTEDLMYKLSERGYPELLAIVTQAEDDLKRIPLRPDLVAVLLDRPQNTGNLGTIIRSGDAMGGDGVLIVEPAVDLYDPNTVRATMGSLFALPVIRISTPQILADWLDEVRTQLPKLQLVGTDPRATKPIDQYDFTGPTILVVGKEQSGMSDDFNSICDALVTIPMFGAADSLNSAVATSVVLYEVNRQRLNLQNTNGYTENSDAL